MDNGDGGEGKVESGPPKLSSDIFVPHTDPIVLYRTVNAGENPQKICIHRKTKNFPKHLTVLKIRINS